MSADELAFVAHLSWRGMGPYRDAWYANRLAPVPDSPVVWRTG